MRGVEIFRLAALGRGRRLLACGLLLAILLLPALPAGARQRRKPVEPQAFRLRITNFYTGVRVEAERDETTYSGADNTSTYERLFLAPVIGLNAMGSIYHPNLVQYSFGGEIFPGYAWQKQNFGSFSEQKEIRFLGNYHANFVILAEKPYRSNLYLGQNYTYRDYDFFNRSEVDSFRYGADLGYQAGPVPFTINAWRRHETIDSDLGNSTNDETNVSFNAHNQRTTGETSFDYSFSDSSRMDGDLEGSDTEHSFGISDSERFGSRQQMLLLSNASYSTRESPENPGDNLSASANVTYEHTPTLTTYYDANYYGSSWEFPGSSAEARTLNGSISLRHQLYQSLASTFRLYADDFSSDGNFENAVGDNTSSTSTVTRYGGSISEQYNKRLGSIGRLSLLASVSLEHTTVDNGGDMIIVTDESHTFSSNGNDAGPDSFFLTLPDVDEGSIVLTDGQNNFPAYREGRDYTLSSNGSLTMVRRTPASTIPQNTTVLVDYRAKSQGSGEYDRLSTVLNARIDLWKGLLALYAQTSAVQSSGSPNLVLDDTDVYTFGAESGWRWVRVGVEYETHNSNLSTYNNLRLFQSLTFKPDAASSFNIDLRESQTNYVDSNREQQYFSILSRYRRAFGKKFGASLDAGFSLTRGEDADQTMATARPEVDYKIGRTTIKAGYTFQYGKYEESNERQRHLLFLSVKRDF